MKTIDDTVRAWLEAPGHVLVVGYAKSGEAAASLLVRHGFRVTVNDQGDKPTDNLSLERLERAGVRFLFGGHPTAWTGEPVQFIVKNPGIPYHVPLIANAMEQGIPILTEVEVASWFLPSPIYAVTGSNGKTTTTTLIGRMLDASRLHPVVAGNIGTAISSLVEHHDKARPVVLELSSFQLMGTATFRPKIAALLNFYRAHLDYHGTYEAYQRAKWKLFANQTESDVAVLNFDQSLVQEGASRLPSEVHYFSATDAPFAHGAAVENGQLVLRRDGVSRPILDVADIALKGPHNLQNVLAAAAVAQAAGATDDAILQVASSFHGVEHRMEFVREVQGVKYYNDSKATNSDATRQALLAFEEGIVWIAGGLDRHLSFDALADVVRGRVKAGVFIGETKAQLLAMCEQADVANLATAESIEEAVAIAHRLTVSGDVVLLSPACASWDMFTSFEIRGSMFKDAVHRL